MPPITILKSELLALEKTIKLQREIIRNQEQIIEKIMGALVDAGLLPDKQPDPASG